MHRDTSTARRSAHRIEEYEHNSRKESGRSTQSLRAIEKAPFAFECSEYQFQHTWGDHEDTAHHIRERLRMKPRPFYIY